MPWCEDCSKFWNPPQLRAGERCPSCARPLGAAPTPAPDSSLVVAATPDTPDGAVPAAKAKGAPWHFKLLVVGVTIYMVYRIYWLAEWLPKHI